MAHFMALNFYLFMYIFNRLPITARGCCVLNKFVKGVPFVNQRYTQRGSFSNENGTKQCFFCVRILRLMIPAYLRYNLILQPISFKSSRDSFCGTIFYLLHAVCVDYRPVCTTYNYFCSPNNVHCLVPHRCRI